jgi:hypothetical protein
LIGPEASDASLHQTLRLAGGLGGIHHWATGLEVDSFGPVDVRRGFRDQQFVCGPIASTGKAVLVEVHQDVAAAAVDR